MSTDDIVLESQVVRKLLQYFNEELGQYINAEQRFLLGRVLTIIDASIADTDQRKAIKDLINNEWWNNNIRPTESQMTNPHSDIRAVCEVLGFELYPEVAGESIANGPIDDLEWIKRRYSNALTTRK